MAEEHYLLAFFNVEVYIVEEHRAVRVNGFQSLNLEYLVARLAFHLEDDARIFPRRRAYLLYVKLLRHFLAACRLLALCHVGREAAYELFKFLALLFGFLTLVLRLTQGKLRAFVPERVVAGEHRDLSEVDIYGLRAHGIEEVAVVAYNEHRLLHVAEICLKPLHGIKVKVVGGLVASITRTFSLLDSSLICL